MKQNKKKSQTRKQKTVVVSGGFDPIHIGHVRMFNEAKKLGDKLVVILNNDNWLLKKKGYVFMPQTERKEIIESFASVDEVVLTSHPKNPTSMGVGNEIEKIKPAVVAQGGDRKDDSLIPPAELVAYKKVGCVIVYNVGKGGKVQSSSWLSTNFINDILKRDHCPCGSKKSFAECGLKRTKEHERNLKKLLNTI